MAIKTWSARLKSTSYMIILLLLFASLIYSSLVILVPGTSFAYSLMQEITGSDCFS